MLLIAIILTFMVTFLQCVLFCLEVPYTEPELSVPCDTGSITVVMALVPKGFPGRRVLSAASSVGCSAVDGGLIFFFFSFCEVYLKEESCFPAEV